MQKATHQKTKEHNRNLVLKTIFESESISRAETARVTGLTRPTVSEIVADLIDEGLVREVGIGSSLGGKSPILLSLVEDSRCVIGLDLAHNQFRGAVINLRGQVRQMVTRPVGNRNSEDALGLVYEMIAELVAAETQPLVGIGVGTPGLINAMEGVVVNAVNLDWRNLPLSKLLHERYSLPVYALNDSQAAAMGEFAYGGHRGTEENLIVINARHGIGAGLIFGGQLFVGDGGGAGEIGHLVVVHEGGLPCRCGNNGCLETVASVQALIRRVQTERALHDVTLDGLVAAFEQGESLARQVVLDAGRYMGEAIASLVGTLNVQTIVLSGDMTRFGQPWLDEVVRSMRRSALAWQVEHTEIRLGQVGPNSVVLGASALLLRDYSLLFLR